MSTRSTGSGSTIKSVSIIIISSPGALGVAVGARVTILGAASIIILLLAASSGAHDEIWMPRAKPLIVSARVNRRARGGGERGVRTNLNQRLKA